MNGITITKKRFLLFIVDLILFPLALFLAYYFRFDNTIPPEFMIQFKKTIVFFLFIRIMVNSFMGLYKGLWRYVGMHDFIAIFKAITLGTFLISCTIMYLSKYNESFKTAMILNHPRSIYIIEWLFSLLFAGGTRSFIRLYREVYIRKAKESREVLIVGAGNAGEMLVRDIQRNPHMGYIPVGFVDDDTHKVGAKIHGIKIIGSIKDIPEIVAAKNVKEIIIAIPSVTSKTMRKIVSYCQECGCEYKTMPGINDIVDGRVTVKQIRNVGIEDLLGREKVELDMEAISSYVTGKSVLITGAGGSIGSELARQVAKFNPSSLILIDNNENSVYFIDQEFQLLRNKFSIIPIVEDIGDEHQMRVIMKKYLPEVVFHAAAHKHVPLMEKFPEKAIKNNVLGTLHLCRVAAVTGVEKFILISTDKAVNPANIMGVTKNIAEKIIQAMNGDSQTKFMLVRFGNVLGSSGSVIPLFKRQIAKGGPITVTHPDIKRYFMTIPEAVQLVIQAGAIGENGNVFVLDMGEPVKIVDLAKELIRLSGLVLGEDIEIVFSGLREGEKMNEELFKPHENIGITKYKKIFMAKGEKIELKDLIKNIGELEAIAKHEDRQQLIRKIKEIVPEYNNVEADAVNNYNSPEMAIQEPGLDYGIRQ